MTAILDRIGIWKCWFLSKRGKPEYPEKNVPLGARERLNKFNKLNPHYVKFQSLSRYARLTSWKIRWRHRIKKNRSSWLDHTRKIKRHGLVRYKYKQKLAPCEGIRIPVYITRGIWKPTITIGIQNLSSTDKNWNAVSGIWNPRYGMQNPRLSWIHLHGAKTEALSL